MIIIINQKYKLFEVDSMEDKNIFDVSFAPTSNAEDIDIYSDYFESLLSDSQDTDTYMRNRNIAVIGSYGSGKSSIIKTYFKDYNNVLYVSLGSYIENSSNSNDSIRSNNNDNKTVYKPSADDMDKIETSILQQILYSKEPSKLPLSRINRIDYDYINVDNCINSISIIITSLLILFFLLMNYDSFSLLIVNTLSMILFFILFLVISIFLFFIVKIIIESVSNFKFNKIKINGVELDTEESDISVLNRNIDELIHFFKQTEYDIVIFEDIDRLNNCLKVFSKLKEINIIINNSLNSSNNDNKTIRFIYAIGDKVFENAEERTKFFDGIISIVPYTGSRASIDLFMKDNNKFNKDLLKVICKYVDNPRVAKDIIIEYSIFDKILNISDNKNSKIFQQDRDSLLVLSAYKVIYPRKYDLLIRNKGKLAYYLSSDFEKDYTKYYIEYDNNKIVELNKIKNTIKGFNVNFDKYFIDYIYNDINNNSPEKPKEIYNANTNELICTFPELKECDYTILENIMNNEIYILCEFGKKLSESIVFNNIPKTDFINLLKFSSMYSNVDDIDNDINNHQKKINNFNINKSFYRDKIFSFLDSKDYNSLPEDYKIVSMKDDDKQLFILNEFEKFIIMNRLLSSTYKYLMVKNHGTTLTHNDYELIKLIENDEKIKYNKKVDNVKEVLDNLSKYDFNNDSICIKEIFREILRHFQLYEDCIEIFFSNLSDVKMNFLIKFDKDNIANNCYKNLSYCENIIDYIEISNYSKSYDNIIARIIYQLRNPSDKVRNHIEKYLGNKKNIEMFFVKYNNYICPYIGDYNINFLQNKFVVSNKYYDFYDILEKYGLLSFNYNLLNSFARIKKYKFNKNKILETVFSNVDDNILVAMFEENIDDALNMISSSEILQKDNEKELISLIEKYCLTDNQIEKIISFEKNCIKDISSFGYYELLKKYNKIGVSFNNVNSLYISNNNVLDNYIIDFVIRNIEILTGNYTSYHDYESLFDDLYESDNIEIDIFKKLIDSTFSNMHYYTWVSNMNVEKNKYLIEKKHIFNSNGLFSNINKIIIKDELDDQHKILYLKYSFNYIKKTNYKEEMDATTLTYLSMICVDNMQDLLDYLYQYDYLFDDDIYQNIFSIVIDNDISISSDKLYKIICNDNILGINKVRLFNKYNDLLFDYLSELLPLFGSEYKDIINNKRKKKLLFDEENLKFAIFLKKKKIIRDYSVADKKILLLYR